VIIDTDDTRAAELVAMITLNRYNTRVVPSVDEVNRVNRAPRSVIASVRVSAIWTRCRLFSFAWPSWGSNDHGASLNPRQ
jgi:hypothetical protein